MALRVMRWSQRKLLYPIAVFAVIVPTVLMALYGTWALREIETRPAGHRNELREVQDRARTEIDNLLVPLQAITPPASADDIARASADAEKYLSAYARAVAQRAYVGFGGRLVAKPAQAAAHADPSELVEFFSLIKPNDKAESTPVRHTINRERGGPLPVKTCFVIYTDAKSGGSIAWELKSDAIASATQTVLSTTRLPTKVLWVEVVDLSSPELAPLGNNQEALAIASVHPDVMPWLALELRRDTTARLWADDTMLSGIFIVIAVLGVPIVVAATLYAVQMILREAAEARKKVDFVSNVTHELKTPLTSIRMFVETLKLGRVQQKEQVDACLDTILQETNRLGTLIDHVLSFSRIENQVKKFNLKPEDLSHVVRDTVNLFKAQMRDQDGVIRLFVLPGIPPQAEFDKDAIREVILNLLSNAIKYSGEEKFVTVRAGYEPDKDLLFIEFTDRGIGIDPIDHKRIFEKFYRVDEALTRRVDGTGLGLTISLEIVKAHGGKIEVDSARGKGSRFIVWLPYKAPKVRAAGRSERTSTREIVARAETPAAKEPG
ncbi:MAG: hypothetical protein IT462_06780 [Planctomycetes bacterium]|nr:hypothetical protein [Planctomycetota bacterium]